MLGSLYSAAARTRSSRWSRSISWFRESTFAFCLAILSFHSSAVFWRAAAAAAAEESTAAAFFPALAAAPGGGPTTLRVSLVGGARNAGRNRRQPLSFPRWRRPPAAARPHSEFRWWGGCRYRSGGWSNRARLCSCEPHARNPPVTERLHRWPRAGAE